MKFKYLKTWAEYLAIEEANRAKKTPTGWQSSVAPLPTGKERHTRDTHGTLACYRAGCRCPKCRAANAAYYYRRNRDWLRRKKLNMEGATT